MKVCREFEHILKQQPFNTAFNWDWHESVYKAVLKKTGQVNWINCKFYANYMVCNIGPMCRISNES